MISDRDPGLSVTPESKPPEPAPSFSALVSRVLEQLSPTSWFPAALLTANLLLLVKVGRMGVFDIGGAFAALVSDPWKWIIAWSFTLVLTAMIAQAFERQAVVVLQGDWSTLGIVGWIRRRRVDHHQRRLGRLRHRYHDVNDRIWRHVKDHVDLSDKAWGMTDHSPSERLEAVEVFVRDTSPAALPDDLRCAAVRIKWEDDCPPELLACRKNLEGRFALFSVPSDMRPTRLGNFIASMYWELADAGVTDPNFVLKNYDGLPSRLTRNHDVAMSRLEMYSSTTCACIGLALLAPLILVVLPMKGLPTTTAGDSVVAFSFVQPELMVPAFLCSAGYLCLAWLNYSAALRAADFLKRSLESIRMTLSGAGVAI